AAAAAAGAAVGSGAGGAVPTTPAASDQAPAAPAARTPTEQRPAAPPPRPPKRKQPPSRKIQPGDLICGDCGEPNDAARKFCRRCAASLAEATVAKTPWWRRLRRKPKAQPEAGTRPGGRNAQSLKSRGRTAQRLLRMTLALAAVALAWTALLGPWRAPVFSWVGDRYDQVRGLVD